VVRHWLGRLRPATVWDLGANTGQFSALAREHGAAHVVALDGDLACVELMYRDARAQHRDWILPLVADLANPSPAIGWSNTERMTLDQRGPADLLLALALVHHLAIANNVPFNGIAAYLARLAGRAIVEFVPRDDAMVRHMMAGREHVFADYHRDAFERAFSASFAIEDHVTLEPSARVLYLLRARA
jgi:ribosomal protein L11 methylase PrmA